MKIFSNFDTNLSHRLFREAQEKYGVENALFVRRDPIYLVMRLLLPSIAFLLFSALLLRIYYDLLGTNIFFSDMVEMLLWIFIVSMFVYVSYYVLGKIISYYMDYVIITPQQITAYDQAGILKRETRSLETQKVKTISILSEWRWGSIFNYGSVIFLSEWDTINGDIKLKFITDPVNLRDEIIRLIELDERQRNIQNNL